jgi:hypothetical protein
VASRSATSGRRRGCAASEVGPAVRIRFPPAGSQVRTRPRGSAISVAVCRGSARTNRHRRDHGRVAPDSPATDNFAKIRRETGLDQSRGSHPHSLMVRPKCWAGERRAFRFGRALTRRFSDTWSDTFATKPAECRRRPPSGK